MVDIKKQLDKIIWDKWSEGKKSELKPSGLGWNQDTMPWKAEFKLNIASDQPFVYRADGKYISFKPTGLWWVTPQGTSVIKQGVNPSVGNLANGKVKYANALGAGINLEMSVDQTTWRKEVTIDSLASLGAIPSGAEFLEISFEIETDFDIEDWDKKTELKFTEAIQLSELSKIESIKAWDNHIVPEPLPGEEPEDPFERCGGFLRVVDGKLYLVKQIPVDYLKQAVYPVTTDIAITYGSEYTFNSATTEDISVAALDSTHFVVIYKDTGDTFGHAKVGVVSSGDVIAYGSEYTFNSANTSRTSVAALDATHFVVVYRDSGGDSYGIARVGVVSSGDVITYGSEYTFNSVNTEDISVTALDSTHFVVGYRDSGGDTFGHAKVGVVSSGDVIAYGSEYTFNSALTTVISVTALDSTHFAVGYKDGGDTFGHAKVGVVSSGDVITYGSEYTFNSATTSSICVAALDSTHFVVGYRDASPFYGHAKVGVVSSGDVIAYGSEYTFNSTGTANIFVAALDVTHFVVGYKDSGGDNFGHAKVGVVSSGDVITYGSEYTFNSATTSYISVAALDSTHFVAGYKDSGGDNFGHAKIGTAEDILENKLGNIAAKLMAAGVI